jgi:hypothetical protein
MVYKESRENSQYIAASRRHTAFTWPGGSGKGLVKGKLL